MRLKDKLGDVREFECISYKGSMLFIRYFDGTRDTFECGSEHHAANIYNDAFTFGHIDVSRCKKV